MCLEARRMRLQVGCWPSQRRRSNSNKHRLTLNSNHQAQQQNQRRAVMEMHHALSGGLGAGVAGDLGGGLKNTSGADSALGFVHRWLEPARNGREHRLRNHRGGEKRPPGRWVSQRGRWRRTRHGRGRAHERGLSSGTGLDGGGMIGDASWRWWRRNAGHIPVGTLGRSRSTSHRL